MYYFMFVLGFVFLVWYNFCFYHIYNMSRKRAILYSFTFIYGVLGAGAMGNIYTYICSINNIEDSSRLAIFGAVIFAPILILSTVAVENFSNHYLTPPSRKTSTKKPKVKIKKSSYADTLDMLTPGLFITLAFGKIGCLYEGCCHGIECSWGVYSDKIEATVFPVQLFEAFTSILILVICYFLKRTRFYRRGMAYPLNALLYCVARFGYEFLRYYTTELRHLFFGITLWQGLCILVIISSLISLLILYKKDTSNPLPHLSFSKKATS